MTVSDYHRRRWDEPRVPVEVPGDEGGCCGELEARRVRDGSWEAWVRCTEPKPETREACTGWFDWGDVRQLDVEDVSRHRACG